MRQPQILRIVVASPGDVQAERDVLDAVIAEMNRGVAADRVLRLEIARSETDAYPGFHPQGPQGLFDSLLDIADCDLLIGIFWKRFGGTPGDAAEPDTEQEFRIAHAAWQRSGRPDIMVYFNQRAHAPKSKAEIEQWGRVLEFQRNFPGEGRWWPYNGKTRFERLVRGHLTQWIRQRSAPPPPPPSAENAPPGEGRLRGERGLYISRAQKEDAVLTGFAEGARIVTLKAGGGMGKTRLAIHCGLRMQEQGRFPDGVFFVSLADRAPSPEAVAEAICQALGIPSVPPDALPGLLRDRQVLLILDNYESVAGEAVGAYLAGLAAETVAPRLLVTGREAVRAGDVEQLVWLDEGMTPDEARQLFVACARLRRREGRGWEPSPDEERQIARILALTERIPLALELAAAWAETETLQDIADGLERTPLGDYAALPEGFVRSDDVRTGGRQRSLVRSLTWSYDRLARESEETAHHFAALSVFADTFTAESVAAVCAPLDARALLRRLHHASLLLPAQQSGRYRLHRFTRAFAAEKLRPLPAALPVQQRFVAHCVQIVRENRNLNDAKVRSTLTDEWQNVVAASETAAEMEVWQSVLYLSNLGNFLGLRGMWSEMERLYERSLAAARTSGNRRSEGRMIYGLGLVYDYQGKWTEAEELYRESLKIFQDLGDRHEQGRILNNLGIVYESQGKWSEAEKVYQQSLKIFRNLGDRNGQGMTLGNLGSVYQSQGKWSEAETVYQDSRQICRELGNRLCEANALNNLGNVYKSQGKWSEAEKFYQQSLVIKRELGDRNGEGRTLLNLARLMAEQEKPAEALAYAQAAVAVLETTEDAALLARARALAARLSGA